jgi:hypothetical protein
MNIKLIDSKYEYISSDDSRAITAKAEGLKIANKLGIDNYSNVEYHQENGYFNFVIQTPSYEIDLQVLIKEKELYYRYPLDNNKRMDLPKCTKTLLGLLNNQNDKSHKFYTNGAVKNFLFTLDSSLRY